MRFKVGDRVEIIDGPDFFNPYCRKFIGHVGVITSAAVMDEGYWRVDDLVTSIGTYATFAAQHMRLKRPPNSEFQPAEPEFVSDMLKRLNKEKA